MPDPAAPITDSQKASNILTALSKILPGFGGMFGGGGGGQPASPLVSPGMVGQAPAMPAPPQVAGAGASAMPTAAPVMPQRQAAPLGPASQTPLPSVSPQNALFQTGFEFSNPQARNAAVASSAIQGVTQLIGQMKERKEAKTKRQAENYMTQITAMQQAGDQEGLNMLLEDPKVIKTLEKGLDYIMPKEPGEPAPPEAQGITAALQKLGGKPKQQQATRLPAPNTPGGVVFPRAPQSQANTQALADLVTKAALAAAQNDPELAKRLGIGTGLSGKEATDAERYQAGLAMSPADERRAFLANQAMLDKFDQENRQQIAELASKEKISSAANRSAEEQTRISAGPLYARVKMSKEIADATLKYRELVTKGKINDANKYIMSTLTSQINNLRTNAEKAKKDGNDDMAADFGKQADNLQKQYDEAQKIAGTDVDSIINNILNEP